MLGVSKTCYVLPKGVDKGLQRGQIPGYDDGDFLVALGAYRIMQTGTYAKTVMY